MLTKIFALLLSILAVDSTRVIFRNYCPDTIIISETWDDPGFVCKLRSGTYCSKDYSGGWMNFQDGYNRGSATTAGIGINYASKDTYQLHTCLGYDLPMQITSQHTTMFTCSDPKCKDAYDQDNTKTQTINTGGTISISWCPSNIQLIGKELKLVETLRNSSSINPKHKLSAVWRKHLVDFAGKKTSNP